MKKIVFLPILFPFHDLVVKWSVSLRSTAERFVVDNNELRILLTSIPIQCFNFENSNSVRKLVVEQLSSSIRFLLIFQTPLEGNFSSILFAKCVALIGEVESKCLTRDSCKLKNVEIVNLRNEIGYHNKNHETYILNIIWYRRR